MTMEVLADWVSKVSNVVWNGLLLYLLVGTGIVFTIRTRFVQVRKFGAGWKHLFGHKAVKVYAAIVVICIVIGSALHVDLVWNLSDLFNGLMVFPNLIALLALSGLVAKAAHDKDIMK